MKATRRRIVSMCVTDVHSCAKSIDDTHINNLNRFNAHAHDNTATYQHSQHSSLLEQHRFNINNRNEVIRTVKPYLIFERASAAQ